MKDIKRIEDTKCTEEIIRTVIHMGQRPTDAQMQEIEQIAQHPVIPDGDAPELTLEQYTEMAALAKKTTFGKGQTGHLSSSSPL